MDHFIIYFLVAFTTTLTIYIEISDTKHPIMYSWTEKTFSTSFISKLAEVSSSRPKKINDKINDRRDPMINQKNSFINISFIIYGFLYVFSLINEDR